MGQWARMAPTRRRTKAAISTPARPLAGPQQRGDKTALAVEHDDRLEAVIVMVGVEQAQLLPAMHAVEGIVDIEHDALGHLPERAAILLDQRPPEAQQRPPVGQVFQPRDRRLRAQLLTRGQTIQRQLEHRVAAQRVGVVAVLVPGGDHQHAEADDLAPSDAQPSPAPAGPSGRLASRSAKPSRRSISRNANNPPSEDSRPPSKRATTALP